ncbi:hypothetical protein CEXT_235741 [Caerostris extrusa]|uniref:Uncharacterized protein n=1 Tax=Caerostris extrusa TaxID=172846 RepID=A0AAV4N5M3_CAEEX|nr:hypothetical protein CEXT_235741 [Caerostris extrusa]
MKIKSITPGNSIKNCLDEGFNVPSDEVKLSDVVEEENRIKICLFQAGEFAAQDKFSIDKNAAKDKDCGQSVKQNIDSTNILKPVEKRKIFAEDELVENKIKKKLQNLLKIFLFLKICHSLAVSQIIEKPLLVNKTLPSNDNETNFKSEFKSCGVADLKESSANKPMANLMPLKSLATNDNETIAKRCIQTFNFVPDLKFSIVHNSSISNKDAILENKKNQAPVFTDELKSAEDNKLPSLNSKENIFKPCLNIFGLKALDADSITSQKNTEVIPENKSLKCKSMAELKALNTMIVPSFIDHKDAMNKNNFQTYNSVTDVKSVTELSETFEQKQSSETSTNNIQSIDYTEVLKDESQNNHVLDVKAIKAVKLPLINCQNYKQLKQPNSFSDLKVLNCDKLPLTNDSNESTLDKKNQSVVLSEIIIEKRFKRFKLHFKGKICQSL